MALGDPARSRSDESRCGRGDSAKWEVNEAAGGLCLRALGRFARLAARQFRERHRTRRAGGDRLSPRSQAHSGSSTRPSRSWTGCGPCWWAMDRSAAPASSWTGGGPGRPSRSAGR